MGWKHQLESPIYFEASRFSTTWAHPLGSGFVFGGTLAQLWNQWMMNRWGQKGKMNLTQTRGICFKGQILILNICSFENFNLWGNVIDIQRAGLAYQNDLDFNVFLKRYFLLITRSLILEWTNRHCKASYMSGSLWPQRCFLLGKSHRDPLATCEVHQRQAHMFRKSMGVHRWPPTLVHIHVC